jgi:hypothetical protein
VSVIASWRKRTELNHSPVHLCPLRLARIPFWTGVHLKTAKVITLLPALDFRLARNLSVRRIWIGAQGDTAGISPALSAIGRA